MDNVAFKKHAALLTTSTNEATSFLEMWSYSDPSFNSINSPSNEDEPLSESEFKDFLNGQGAFQSTSPALPDGVHLIGGMRLIIQNNIEHPQSFSPFHVSMKTNDYLDMIAAFHLPRIAVESSSIVGPFFWYGIESDEKGLNTRLQMIMRNSDCRGGYRGTWGWEFMLSHDFSSAVTTGFVRRTNRSLGRDWTTDLKDCILDIGHAMLIPLLVIDIEVSGTKDSYQREARKQVRELELAISMRTAGAQPNYKLADGVTVDLPAISSALATCQSHVLWNPPAANLEIIATIREADQVFRKSLPANRRGSPVLEMFHTTLTARLSFYEKRLRGIQTYGDVTKHKLEVQRNTLYNLMAQKDSKLNLQMAADQRLLATQSKRESEAMKGLSLLGAVFLPGAFLASIFSTTFFNFWDTPDIAAAVSPKFWLFLAVTIPSTILIVCLYFLWERRRTRRYEREDTETYGSLDMLEASILASMRPAPHGPVRTWTEAWRPETTNVGGDRE
ncbi:hypothetical protein QBC37DRAFT_342599 [Rhypophila decipiens]|uniref:Uncharacterized protein n=1 Tax=Rhypophila decipiens TaxID=261697 RepID=A0AAN7B8Q3_9PEZI|nr:hypothetical protein QBC37DRAFT_342599 [Rhypophila decipiens]